MPIIADPSGKLYDIPDDVFAARMQEVCKGYEMSEQAALEYLRREKEVMDKLRASSNSNDQDVKAYMNWNERPGDTVHKPMPFDPYTQRRPQPWSPRPRPWYTEYPHR